MGGGSIGQTLMVLSQMLASGAVSWQAAPQVPWLLLWPSPRMW